MHHEVFGEILYDEEDAVWRGRCSLPAFAEYGRPPCDVPDEPDEDFRRGVFPLTIRDESGAGPSPRQANAFRFLLQNEAEVCRAVAAQLLASYRLGRDWEERLKKYRDAPLLGRVVGWLIGKEAQTPEDLKPAARCAGVEVATLSAGEYAYLGFAFDTTWEIEHGLVVVYHPQKGAPWGDATALGSVTDAAGEA
jgi:hypothetical protein